MVSRALPRLAIGLRGEAEFVDPVALSGKRGWDVILFRVRGIVLRSPHESSRRHHVSTISGFSGPAASDGESVDRRDREREQRWEEDAEAAAAASRDIADVPAVEVITTTAVHLMSAAAVKVGLADDPDRQKDLDEARKLINALEGLITAGAPEISDMHARSLRDGLRSLQLAFREASVIPDPIGKGPGEKWTGPVT